jgi:hypothetical protein
MRERERERKREMKYLPYEAHDGRVTKVKDLIVVLILLFGLLGELPVQLTSIRRGICIYVQVYT